MYAQSPPSDSGLRSWFRSFENVRREHGFEPLRVEGTVPDGLAGTYVRNGPGLVSLLGHRYTHWFDGDGLLTTLRVRDGRAEGAVRLIETLGLLEERRRGRAYFGAYGSVAPGMFNPVRAWRSIRGTSKNPANTNVLAWNDRLFALCEIGRPFEVDPRDLRSIGETDFDGVIPRAFSAHPHRVAANGRVYNFGLQVGRPNAIDLFVMRPDGTSGRIGQVPLRAPTLIHDFAATERYLVFFIAPLRLSLLPVLLGRASFAKSLEWTGHEGTEVIVVPLDAPGSPIRFRTDAFWAWHIGNAFERGGEIVVDLVHYPDFPSTSDWLDGVARGAPNGDANGFLTRTVIDVGRRTLRHDRLTDRSGEFPRVAPVVDARPHHVVFWTEHASAEVGRNGPPNAIVRVDVESGERDGFVFAEGHYPSEAVFAPRPGSDREDDGWLLSLVYDAHRHTSYFAVLEANDVAGGPIATMHLDQHVPLSFHGQWIGAHHGIGR